MKYIYLAFLACLIPFSNQAQILDWAKSFGSIQFDESQCIAIDNSGNVLTTGRFMDTVDFDPGANTLNLSSNGDRDVFIQKLDASGNLIWAVAYGGLLRDDGYSITTDNTGNVYVTGRFEGTVDFDPGTQIFNLTANGNRDIYVLKLDASGNLLWVKAMGELQNDRGYSIITDASGNVYVTGYFAGTVDFDPGAATFNLSSAGDDDVFILKLDASGNFIWANAIGGNSYDEGWVITSDISGNLYITGYFEGMVDFDPGLAVFNLTSNGSIDAFILKLDASGNFVWAKAFGSSTFDSGHSINTDDSGNVYTTGYFEGTVDFDPGVATFNLTSNGQADAFIQKLDASGNFIWAKAIGSTSSEKGYSIINDATGSIYVTGFFEGTVDFDPGTGVFNLTSNGQSDIFILKLNDSGNFMWAGSVGSTTSDLGYSIKSGFSGNVYVTGYFSGTADFDPGAATVNLTSNGQTDFFIQKLNLATVGIEDYHAVNSPVVFPNPTTEYINIDISDFKNASIKVYDITGKLIYINERINAGTPQLQITPQPGVYFVELLSKNEKLIYKVIKL